MADVIELSFKFLSRDRCSIVRYYNILCAVTLFCGQFVLDIL